MMIGELGTVGKRGKGNMSWPVDRELEKKQDGITYARTNSQDTFIHGSIRRVQGSALDNQSALRFSGHTMKSRVGHISIEEERRRQETCLVTALCN